MDSDQGSLLILVEFISHHILIILLRLVNNLNDQHFSNEFDTVDHKFLINELVSLGIGNFLILCIRSYFSDRKQFEEIHEIYSYPINVTLDVPQDGI